MEGNGRTQAFILGKGSGGSNQNVLRDSSEDKIMGRIHLIRHGITEAVKARVYYGSTDLPLSNEGVDRIVDLALAGIYPEADGAKLYTSGLLRTEQTFFLIYGCREHQAEPQLREYDFGQFEMKTDEQLMDNEAYQGWLGDKEGVTPCPGGKPEGFQGKGCRRIFRFAGQTQGRRKPGREKHRGLPRRRDRPDHEFLFSGLQREHISVGAGTGERVYDTYKRC